MTDIKQARSSAPARLARFLGASGLALLIAGPLVGLTGTGGLLATAIFGTVWSILLLGVTLLCVRLDRANLAASGMDFSLRRLGDLGLGLLLGIVAFAGVALTLGFGVGARWRLSPDAILPAGLGGLGLILSLILSEELLFRGYGFQQLKQLYGPRGAAVLSAGLFGGYHLVGSGDWAIGAVFRFLLPALGGLVFAYALLRSGSLALPLGLHWGGNWAQTWLFGLGQDPATGSAIWAATLTPAQVHALAAPDLLPRLPYLAALVLMVLAVRRTTGHPGAA